MKTDTPSRPAQRPGGRGASIGRRMLKVGLAFVTAVLLVNLLTGNRGLPAVLQARREFDVEAQRLERVRADNQAKRTEINRLRVDAAAVEEVARRELGLIEPGEKLFIIQDVPSPDATESTPPSASPQTESR